jgi:hypothetical protein
MTRALDRAAADTAEHKELGHALVVTAIAIVSALLNAAIYRLISGPAAPLADGR